jgi:hypothetical protein
MAHSLQDIRSNLSWSCNAINSNAASYFDLSNQLFDLITAFSNYKIQTDARLLALEQP